MFGGRGIDLHAADRIDRERGYRSLIAFAVVAAAAGMRGRAVPMAGVGARRMIMRMIVIRYCHRKRFPAVRRPLNYIP
jgi:hypothetical protein